VLGYLEKVKSSVFSDFPKEITSLVAGKHGVYALYKGDHLYYVGLASDLHRRVNHHLRDKHAKKWNSFSLYLIHKSDHIKELEALILRIADPKGNSVKGRMPHAENMTYLLKSHIKQRQGIALNSVLNLSEKPVRKKTIREIVKEKSSETEGRQPSLAPYAGKRFELKRVYKEKTYKAFVLADGTIRYAEKIYGSPSLAAVAVTGRPINGWTFWQFKNASGNWIKLDALRK
jgi:hypothetical protein